MDASADNLLEAERKAQETIAELRSMEDSYAMARQVVGLRDDRLKQRLAMLVAEYLGKDNSATASETLARADERWDAAIKEVIDQTAAAQKIVAHWDFLHMRFELCQALMNNERRKMGSGLL
jgi:hypothetical protein